MANTYETNAKRAESAADEIEAEVTYRSKTGRDALGKDDMAKIIAKYFPGHAKKEKGDEISHS